MPYDLELYRVVKEIREAQAKTVCIQLADGLKPAAKEIQQRIMGETGATVLIWAESLYGACDTPDLRHLHIDMLIQFGHSEWKGMVI